MIWKIVLTFTKIVRTHENRLGYWPSLYFNFLLLCPQGNKGFGNYKAFVLWTFFTNAWWISAFLDTRGWYRNSRCLETKDHKNDFDVWRDSTLKSFFLHNHPLEYILRSLEKRTQLVQGHCCTRAIVTNESNHEYHETNTTTWNERHGHLAWYFWQEIERHDLNLLYSILNIPLFLILVLDSCIASVAERTDVRDSFDSSFDAISLGNASSSIKLTIEHTVAKMTFLVQKVSHFTTLHSLHLQGGTKIMVQYICWNGTIVLLHPVNVRNVML